MMDKLDVSYVQGKSRICKVIHEKIKATPESTSLRHVRVVGLYGGGGTGKTTFCKAMCNEMWTEFNGKAFHIELEGESELKTSQTLLTWHTGAKKEDVQRLDMWECRHKKLTRHPVFIAIDNVTDSPAVIAQAETLLRWYAKGSVVLVTARSLDLLENLKTFIRMDDCMEMPELEETEARSLLLHHAAPSSPVNEDVLRLCLQRCYFRKDDDDECCFLPLALEALGVHLGDDADQWSVKLEELDREPPIYSVVRMNFDQHPVFSVLRKSFDALRKEDQILFIDVALFYPRTFYHDPSWNISTIDWLHMVHGASVEDITTQLKGLKEKSLLQSVDTKIGVHDLWREFAVTEANKSSLWYYDNYEDGHVSGETSNLRSSGWEDLQRAFIWRKGGKLKEELNFSQCSHLASLTLRNVPLVNKTLDLSPLKHLKYLEVHLHEGPRSVQVVGLGSLAASLVVLRWFNMVATSPSLQEIGLLINLEVLQLQFLRWKKTELSRLSFQRMDFTKLNSLRTFHLSAPGDDCTGVQPFHRDVRVLRHQLEDLTSWNFHVYDGYLIESFQGFQQLRSLQELDISRCIGIKALPGLDELVSLLKLKATGCTSLESLPSLHNLQRLQTLEVAYCISIRALPGLDELVGLLELDACGCCRLAELPSLHKLQKLQRLDVAVCSSIKALPGLGELISLVELHVAGCSSLEQLPSLENLQRLQKLDLSWCPLIKSLPGLGDVVALQELRAKECYSLAELPDVGKLTSLRVLNLKMSHYYEEYRLKYPEYFSEERYHFWVPEFTQSASVKAVPGLGELTSLSKLTVEFRVFEGAPDLCKLENLTKVSLRGWSSGAAAGAASLPNLQALTISYTDGLQMVEPAGISGLRSLRRLKFHKCDFEDVTCLNSLPAFRRLHVKIHGKVESGAEMKKLLLSVLALPSLQFTVRVEVGDNRDWYPIWDEIQMLTDRSINVD